MWAGLNNEISKKDISKLTKDYTNLELFEASNVLCVILNQSIRMITILSMKSEDTQRFP